MSSLSRERGERKTFLKEKQMPGELVKCCSTLLHSQPQHAATNDCPKRQRRKMLLSFARLGPQGRMQSMSEKGKVGWGLCRRLVLLLQAGFFIVLRLPSGFCAVLSPIFSLFPCFLFPLVKCITGTWDVSEYCAFMTPRTSTRASEHPETQADRSITHLLLIHFGVCDSGFHVFNF